MADASAARIEGTWARHAVAHARALREADPSWGTRWFELADGVVVLQGPGLYVNRGLALGLRRPVGADDLDELERASAEAGVVASVDVVPATDPELVRLLAARGYAEAGTVSVMTMALDASSPAGAGSNDVVVRPVADGDGELCVWQRVSIEAWQRTSAAAQRASDAYAAAAHATDGERLMLAFDAVDGRPLGCATLIVQERLATLGGMSTLPAERGRGVQRALVAERLRLAAAAGCDVAASSAALGGASERNLLRLGFEHRYVKTTWTRP